MKYSRLEFYKTGYCYGGKAYNNKIDKWIGMSLCSNSKRGFEWFKKMFVNYLNKLTESEAKKLKIY